MTQLNLFILNTFSIRESRNRTMADTRDLREYFGRRWIFPRRIAHTWFECSRWLWNLKLQYELLSIRPIIVRYSSLDSHCGEQFPPVRCWCGSSTAIQSIDFISHISSCVCVRCPYVCIAFLSLAFCYANSHCSNWIMSEMEWFRLVQIASLEKPHEIILKRKKEWFALFSIFFPLIFGFGQLCGKWDESRSSLSSNSHHFGHRNFPTNDIQQQQPQYPGIVIV